MLSPPVVPNRVVEIRMKHPLWIIALSGLPALGGCSTDTLGVRVTNQTDQIVRAELLQLRKDGDLSVYSFQTLGPGAEFANMVAGDERRRGMRVRFLLAGQKLEDGNWVMLNLPEKHSRLYDLMLVGGRLTARELKRGDKPTFDKATWDR